MKATLSLPFITHHIVKPFNNRMRVMLTLAGLIILTACGKEKEAAAPVVTNNAITPTATVLTTDPPVIYAGINNPGITLSNYTYNTNKTDYFVGKVYPASTLATQYKFSANDLLKVYVRNDSLFLTNAGRAAVINDKFLDIDLLITNNGSFKKSFRIVKDDFLHNRVVAHRGAWAKLQLPENSIASLKQAITIGCQASETDVHLTSDKVVVISHDPLFMGLAINNSTYAQLSQKKLANGESIPKLEEYLTQLVKQNKTRLKLEIKPSASGSAGDAELTDSVLSLVHQLKAQAHVDYISFSYDILKRVLNIDKTATVEYLSGNLSAAQLKKEGMGMNYNYGVLQKDETLITQSLLNGVSLGAWTIDDKATILWWLSKNPGAITTNQPELALQYFK